MTVTEAIENVMTESHNIGDPRMSGSDIAARMSAWASVALALAIEGMVREA